MSGFIVLISDIIEDILGLSKRDLILLRFMYFWVRMLYDNRVNDVFDGEIFAFRDDLAACARPNPADA